MSCGATCAKFLLQFFNFVFWLTGCVLLGVSIWILVDNDAWKLLHVATLGSSEDLVRSAAITLCVVGSVVFFIAFLGCCGAMKESVCMLNTVVPDTCCVLVDEKATDHKPTNRTACNIAAQTHSTDGIYYHYQIFMIVLAFCLVCEVRNKGVLA
ncbi:hypothetical protein LSH36_304g01029 [Paralvinella palmiformis]|uniref:Tetraspanin n=1 Tax=Paralvinella palmiformis TaxID=53620 RepID=A0AAD9JIA3_9ANNE|nr:hypothetical protein LSH36_304g01029 [Paralvinella palmiformis]